MAATEPFRPMVGFVGAGRFGLALAEVAARNGVPTVLFTSLPERLNELQSTRRCADVLPELDQLHPSIRFTGDAAELAESAHLLIVTLGMGYFHGAFERVGEVLDGAHMVVHAVHTLDGRDLRTSSDAIRAHSCVRQLGVIAGPTHVSELLSDRPNAAVVGSAFPRLIRRCQDVFAGENFRVYGNRDAYGVELAAALGQLVAVAVGIADGLDLGAATHATLLTRGLAEIARIGAAVGANEKTFAGLAGIGRLVDGVRRGEPNYQLGVDIARSSDVPATVLNAPPDAQGARVAAHVREFAEHHHHAFPIVEALVRIFDASWTPEEAMRSLMQIDQMYE